MLKKHFRMKIFIVSTFLLSNLIVSESKHRLKNEEFGPKIVGGNSVALEKYPFAIQFFNLGALCGGVILNSWSVLTSGHCLENNHDIDEMAVQIGENTSTVSYQRNSSTLESVVFVAVAKINVQNAALGSKYIYDFSAKKHKLASFVVHENYSIRIPFENDIALLFVKRPMKFNEVAKKVILVDHAEWMSARQKRFIVMGWGWQKYGGSLSEMSLMMASLRYVPVKQCSQAHNVELSDDMFCLYGGGQRDTCRGDSGGGVLWHGKLVGLTSHGDGCAKKGKPSVYTNIFYLRGWIKKQMQKFVDNYCRSNFRFVRAGNIVTINNTN